MDVKIPISDDEISEWVEVAHGARFLQFCLQRVGNPAVGSAFAQMSRTYPSVRVSDRALSYLGAAVQHLVFWADSQAPLKFHPEQSIEVTLRPSYTLARAALESAAQAVWLMDTTDERECIRRHIGLIRWDLQELRKSKLDLAEKDEVRKVEESLVADASTDFSEKEIQAPNGYLDVIRSACEARDLKLEADDAERLWRAASGVAHGKYWPNLELQTLIEIESGGSEGTREVQIPDLDGITEVVKAAYRMTNLGVLKFLDYSGADTVELMKRAFEWISEVTPLKEGASREELRDQLSTLKVDLSDRGR